MATSEGLTASEALAALVSAVQEAGEIGLRYARDGARIFTKADTSPVTEADLAIDRHLAERLGAVSGAVGWLSEEAQDTADRLSRRQLWIVDPIDGTRGFMAGNGEWVISAALVDAGRPLAGVLLRPTTGDLYWATRGGGAFKNGQALAARSGTMAQVKLAAGPKFFVDALREAVPRAARHPSLASLALRLAFVAEGTIDAAFAKTAAHDWDVAAADIIVSEAGGVLTGIDGAELVYNGPDPVHPALVAAAASRQAEIAAAVRHADGS